MAESKRGPLRWLAGTFSVGYLKAAPLIPLPILRVLLIALGRILLPLVPRLHRVGRQQLEMVYGDSLSPAEKKRILCDAMDNMCTVAAELPHLPKVAARAGGKALGLAGWEQVDPERGCLLISAHLGNWEWMASALAVRKIPICEVVRPLDDPRLDAEVDRIRRCAGAVTLPKDNAGDELMRRLKEKEVCGVLVDQCPRENAVPTTFLGQPCWSTIAAAMIALRAKVPVHAAVMVREAPGVYVLRVQPPIEFVRTGNLLEDLQENSQRCQLAIEEMVRRYPGQWLWFHRRWKKRPRLEEEWEARKQRNKKNLN